MSNFTKILISVLVVIFVFSFLTLAIIKSVNKTKSAINGETTEQTADESTDCDHGTTETTDTDQTTAAETSKQIEIAKEYEAEQIFIYNIDTQNFIYEKGTENNIRPASITKLLTALYALDVMSPDEVITVRKDELDLVAVGSSKAFVYVGNQLTLSMLIEGMMLPSGNDAAYAVAGGVARYVSGNDELAGDNAVQYFVAGMNAYAKKIGCTGTVFTVPDGLALEGHYTTAHDLAIIASLVSKNETIMQHCSKSSDKVVYVSKQIATWKNTNKLIDEESEYYCKEVTGLKTGSLTDDYSVMVTANINNGNYIIGIFGSNDKNERFAIAKELIEELKKQV